MDVLSSRIMELQSSKDVISLFAQDKDKYRPDQICLMLRVIGRNLHFRKEQETETALSSPEFQELLDRIQNNINFMTEQSCSDVLYFLRRYQNVNRKRLFSNEFMRELNEKAIELLEGNGMNFGLLSNIFYDMKSLGMNSHAFSREIAEKLKEETIFVSNFFASSVTSVLAEHGVRNFQEIILLEALFKKIEASSSNLDSTAIVNIFKNISQIKPHLIMMPFIVPRVMYQLRSIIISNIESLNEQAVGQILEAYKHLPKEFPRDLLDEIKEMYLLTIEFSPDSVFTRNAMEFVYNFMNIRFKGKNLTDEQKQKFQRFMMSKLERDFFSLINRPMQEKINYLIRFGFFSHTEFVSEFYKLWLNLNDFKIPSFELLVSFRIQLGNVDEMIEKIYERIDDMYVGFHDLMGIQLFLQKNDHPLAAKFTESVQAKYATFHNSLKKLEVFLSLSSKGLKCDEQIEEAFDQLVEEQEPKRMTKKVYSVLTKNGMPFSMKEKVREFITSKIDSKAESSNFISGFMSNENQSLITLHIFLDILTNIPQEHFLVNKFLSLLSNNEQLIMLMERDGQLVQKVMKILRLSLDNEEMQDINLMELYKLFSALEKAGFGTIQLYNYWRSFYFAIKSKTEENVQSYSTGIDKIFLSKILSVSRLSPDQALFIYEKIKDDIHNNYISKLLLINSAIKHTENDSLVEEMLNNNIEKLMDKSNKKASINLFCEILSMPPRFITDPQIFIDHMNEILSFSNTNSYIKILRSLSKENITGNHKTYFVVLKELQQYLENNVHRFGIGNLIQVLECYSRMGSQSSRVITSVLNEVIKKKLGLKMWQIVSLVESLAKMKTHNSEFLDFAIDFVLEKNFHMKKFGNYFLRLLSVLGYKSESFRTLLENKMTDTTINDISSYYQAYSSIILESEHEAQLVSTFFENFNEPSKQLYIDNIRQFANYCKFKYNNESWNEKIKLIEGEAEIYSFNKFYGNFGMKMIERVKKCLQAMKVEFEENKEFANLNFTFYFPSQSKAILLIDSNSLTNDKQSLNGKGTLLSKTAQLSPYKVIQVSIFEVKNQIESQDLIKYLTSLGVESTVSPDEYDYSLFEEEYNAMENEDHESESDSLSSSEEEEIQEKLIEDAVEDDAENK